MSRKQEDPTLAQFDRMIERAWGRHAAFERAAEYRDEGSHDLVRGNDEWAAYAAARDEVLAWAGRFPLRRREVEALP